MNTTIEEQIIEDRVDILFDSFKSAILAYYVGPVFLFAYVFYTQTEYLLTLQWLVAMLSVNTLIFIVRTYQRVKPSRNFRRWLVIGALVGLGWGSAFGSLPYFIATDDPILHMVVLTVTSANIVAGLFLFGMAYKISIFYYIPLTLLPVFHAITTEHSALQLVGYIFILWVPTSIMVTKSFDEAMSRSLILSRKNEEWPFD